MLIALDYDDTYTKAPGLWRQFIDNALSAGNKVVCVTMRPDVAMTPVYLSLGHVIGVENIFNTNGKAKASYVEKLGLKVDVWIDDFPAAILLDKEDIPNFDHTLYNQHLNGKNL